MRDNHKPDCQVVTITMTIAISIKRNHDFCSGRFYFKTLKLVIFLARSNKNYLSKLENIEKYKLKKAQSLARTYSKVKIAAL